MQHTVSAGSWREQIQQRPNLPLGIPAETCSETTDPTQDLTRQTQLHGEFLRLSGVKAWLEGEQIVGKKYAELSSQQCHPSKS